ncbi:hypothetical protein LTR86_009553 [Recurvomyces mirabilis]|nr:hypothetical protein LTR86_009553 [Recurvomyces mirabilis]
MQTLLLRVASLATLLVRILAASNFTAAATESGSDSISSSTNIGDYVAVGLDLPSTATSTGVGDAPYANTTVTGGNTVTAPSTSYFSSCQATTTDSRGQAYADCSYGSTIVTNTFTNTTWASATNAEECWTEWVSYWSMHTPSPATISVISYAVPATTETTPYVYTEGSYITDQTTTTTITSTAPTVADNGGFTQTLSQVVVTYTTVLTAFLSANTTSTSIYTRTYTPWSQNYTLISATIDANWPAPSCTLPAVYPACQSQWDAYATHNVAPNPQPLSAKSCTDNVPAVTSTSSTTPNLLPACYTNIQSSWASWRSYVDAVTSPVCSQAAITSALCTSLKDAYVLGHNYNLAPNLPEPASFSSGYYSNIAPWFTSWTWPATQAFAPGCTLDCGRCAVTGGTIELLYFPPGLTAHPKTGAIVATTLGTVLTSPTYYISFASLYASDACSGVGSTLKSMIFPIPTSEPLSTLFATTMPCDAHRENNAWLGLIDIGTAAFNVTDLMYDSVPYSIYTSQPYCASQIAASGCQADACPTTLPYRPLIVLSSRLLNRLDPAWATCSLDLRGLYDPPKALQPATAEVLPTTPGAAATVSATPASGPATVTPDPTAQPVQQTTTPSQNAAPHTPNTSASPPASNSPSAGIPASSPNSPAASPNDPVPVASQSSPQPNSADQAGILVSVIAGDSSNTASNQVSATDPAISIPGTSTAQSVPAQKSPSSATNALQALTASPADLGTSGGLSQAHTSQAGNLQPAPSSSGGIGSAQQGAATSSSSNSAASGLQQDPGVIVNGQTLQSAQPTNIGGVSVTAVSGAFIIGSTTIAAGTVPYTTTIGSQAVTLQAASSFAADPAATGQTVKNNPTVFSVGSQAVTATPGQSFVIAGSTLSGNVAVTVSGHTYSSGTAGLVIDGTSTVVILSSGAQALGAGSTFGFGSSSSAAVASQAVITIGSSTLTAVLPSGTEHVVVIAGTTLSPDGSAATIDGTEVSAGTGGLVVGRTSTASFSAATDPSQTGSRSTSTPAGSSAARTAASSTASTSPSSGSERTFAARLGCVYAVVAIFPALGTGLI